MTDTLDSRALRLTDCYGQRFMRPGTFRYGIFTVDGDLIADDRPFTVRVVERGAHTTMMQKTVVVRADGGALRAEPPEVTIEAGDLVLWNCPDAGAPPYMVVGDTEFFSSRRLVNESGFSHAFGSAGEYHWVDAYGSGTAGIVRVKDPGGKTAEDVARWHKALAQGTLVMIVDGRAEPRQVDIVTGQTVFFAVAKGPGISITDERLLASRDARVASVSAPAPSPRGSARSG